jgi:Flp pilus assembly CpaE family ATPase
MADRVVTVALLGGDSSLERELAAVSASVGLALVPGSALDRADAILVADGPDGAALDVVRSERTLRPGRPALIVGDGPGLSAAAAMASGARGVVTRPLEPVSLRAALEAAGCFDTAVLPPRTRLGGPIVLLGAAGGVGTTTCAVAIAAARSSAVLDLDLAAGDAAAVAGAEVRIVDAMLALALAPSVEAGELDAQLAEGPACRVLPAPSLPEHADLIGEADVGRLLDAGIAAGRELVVDGGQRIGVETVPALERAAAVAIVSTVDRRGLAGVRRVVSLLGRLGLAERRPVGLVGTRVRRGGHGAMESDVGLPVWATVDEHRDVARARERHVPPPARPFARLVAALEEVCPR